MCRVSTQITGRRSQRRRGSQDDDLDDGRGWGDEHSAFMSAFSTLFLPNGSPEQIKAYAELQRMATSPETAVKIRMIHDETDIRVILPKVQVPAIVFHSRHDNAVPFEQGRLVAAAIPNAKFVPLESNNHVLLSHEPALQCSSMA